MDTDQDSIQMTWYNKLRIYLFGMTEHDKDLTDEWNRVLEIHRDLTPTVNVSFHMLGVVIDLYEQGMLSKESVEANLQICRESERTLSGNHGTMEYMMNVDQVWRLLPNGAQRRWFDYVHIPCVGIKLHLKELEQRYNKIQANRQ